MIIGFGHEQRTGKDTAAQPLVALGFKKVGFADALKQLAYEADPMLRGGATVNVNIGHGRLAHAVNQLGWERAKDDMPEVRRFLQQLGVAARKVFGEDFWIDQWERAAAKAAGALVIPGSAPIGDVVVADVRFQNEFDRLRELGAVLIKISRPGYGAVAGSHVSELELADADWDHTIVNDGTIVDLHSKVLALVVPLMDKKVAA